MQTRSEKVRFLKGLVTGYRTLKELLPKNIFNVLTDEAGHHVVNQTTKESRLLSNDEFEAWQKNNHQQVQFHLIEGETDIKDLPIK